MDPAEEFMDPGFYFFFPYPQPFFCRKLPQRRFYLKNLSQLFNSHISRYLLLLFRVQVPKAFQGLQDVYKITSQMCQTAGNRNTAFLFFFERLVAGISVTGQCPGVAPQEFPEDFGITGTFILKDHNPFPGPQLTGAEYPEIALTVRFPVRPVLLYGNRSLVGLYVPAFQHELGHPHYKDFEILKTIPDHPSIDCLAGQLSPISCQLLFQSVNRKSHDKFRVQDPGQDFRGCQAFGRHLIRFCGPHDLSAASIDVDMPPFNVKAGFPVT